MGKKFYTEEAARLIGVAPDTLRDRLIRGKLQHTPEKRGGKTYRWLSPSQIVAAKKYFRENPPRAPRGGGRQTAGERVVKAKSDPHPGLNALGSECRGVLYADAGGLLGSVTVTYYRETVKITAAGEPENVSLARIEIKKPEGPEVRVFPFANVIFRDNGEIAVEYFRSMARIIQEVT